MGFWPGFDWDLSCFTWDLSGFAVYLHGFWAVLLVDLRDSSRFQGSQAVSRSEDPNRYRGHAVGSESASGDGAGGEMSKGS